MNIPKSVTPSAQSTRSSRRVRQQIVPIITWLVAIAVFMVYQQHQSTYQFAVGIVETDEATISPLKDGTIRSLRVDIFDSIEAGDIVAMMDDTLVVAELTIKEAQLAQIKAELNMERNRLQSDFALGAVEQLDELRRYQLDEEKARLAHLELRVEVEAKKIKLERLKIQMDRQELLVNQAIGDQSTYDDVRLRHEELNKELTLDQKALAHAQKNIEDTVRRRTEREDQSSPATIDSLLYLEPYIQELNVQEARRKEIQDERMTLVLRAPIAGQVTKIYYGPGETLLSGTPLLSIQSKTANRVVAYVDEHSATQIQPNMKVQLRSTTRPHIIASARVLRTRVGLEELPSRVWSTPFIAEWGVPVLIGEIPEGLFLPSETVNVRFDLAKP